MAKMSLIEMVQDVLSDMDSDEVNSINDTIEAMQVAQIIKTCYFELIGTRNWPHLSKLVSLTASGDSTKPTHMKMPDNLKELEFINYNKQRVGETRRRYEEIKYKYPDDFLIITNHRDNDKDTVSLVTDYSGIEVLISNDCQPTYWTSFDDKYIVFDSFDSEVESTLQTSKVQAKGYVTPTWTMSDEFIPDLPEEAFPTFLAEAKSTAFFSLKQMANDKAEQKAARGNRWLARKSWKAKGGIRYPDYGRMSKK